MNHFRYVAFFLLAVVLLIPALTYGSELQYHIDGMTVSDPVEKVFSDYPELTELSYDFYTEKGWEPEPYDYITVRPFMRIDTRHHWIPDRDYLSNRYLISLTHTKTGFVPNLHVIYYQKLRKAYYPENLGQAGLFFNTKGLVRQFVLGSFSLQAGEGLSLGSYSGKSKTEDIIKPAYTLSHPVLTGAAVQLKNRRIEGVIWLSQTERLATMDGDKIARLYESLISDLKDKDKIQEKTNGILVKYYRRNNYLGLHYYRQEYSKLFADSTFNPVSDVFGVWGSFNYDYLTLKFETDIIDGKTAYTGRLAYLNDRLDQSLGYIYRPETGPLSFSRTNQIFGQKTAAQEISWDANYNPVKELFLTSRIAAFKDLTDESDTKWKERLILAADWREDYWRSGLTWYRFRKDAVAAYDSLTSEILPTQNRLRAHWNQQFHSGLKVGTVIQYQHYIDQSISKNGFSLQQSMDYEVEKVHLKLSFLGWVNQKSSYQASEDQADDELLIQAGSDSALRLQLEYRLGKAFTLGLGSYFPFRNTANRSLRLNLKTAI